MRRSEPPLQLKRTTIRDQLISSLALSARTKLFFIAYFAWLVFMSIPWQLTLQFRVAGITLVHGINAGLGAVGVILFWRWIVEVRPHSLPVLAMLIYLGVVSIINYPVNEGPKFNELFSLDLLAAVGLLVGVGLAHERDLIVKMALVTVRWGAVALALLCLSLAIGIVPTTAGEGRLLDPAGFILCFLICVFLPTFNGAGISPYRFSGWTYFAYSSVFLFGIISLTRSVLIVVAATFIYDCLVGLRRRGVISILLGATIAGAVLIQFGVADDLQERFQSRTLREEDRTIELALFAEDFERARYAVIGLGLGSGAQINAPGEMSIAPHIGILAFPFKAGVAGIVFVLWGTLTIAARALRDTQAFGGLAWIGLAFVVQASISGGWNFISTMLFAMCAGLALQKAEHPRVLEPHKQSHWQVKR